MQTSKYTVFVDIEKSKVDNLTEVISKMTNNRKGEEVLFSVLDIKNSKPPQNESSSGLYINFIKSEKEPAFKFKDSMFSLVNNLKEAIEKKSVMTFTELIDAKNSVSELNNVSDYFIEFVENNAEYYNR